MKPSMNYIKTLLASAPENEFFEYFFRFNQYHNRYDADLSPEDYYPNQGMAIYDDWKGYLPNTQHERYSAPDAIGQTGTLPLHPKVETYYRKIIELCQSRDIPLHIVTVPYYHYPEDAMRLNRAEEIAREYGVPFTNYNKPELLASLNFDFATDMSFQNHLLYDTSIRFTRAFGELLVSEYAPADRRGDPRYASWERSAAFYRRDFANYELRRISDIGDYLSRIAQDPNYTAIISVTGYCTDYFDQIIAWLSPFGIDDLLFAHDMNGTWVSSGNAVIESSRQDARPSYVQLNDTTITFDPEHHPIVDRDPVRLTEKGLNLVIYHHVTRAVVDTVGFDALNGFSAVR